MKKYALTAAFLIACSLIFAQVEMGGTADYSEIKSDGTLWFHGEATVWTDFVIDPVSTANQANSPSLKTFVDGDMMALAFEAGNQVEEVFFDVQMPHSWEEGSTIYPHIHWAPGDGSTGNVVWYLDYTWANIDGTFTTPVTVSSGAVAAGGEAFKHNMTMIPTGGIPGTNKTISSVLTCRLYRDHGDDDTYNNDAFAVSIDIHYKLNTVGSRTPSSK